MIKKHLHIASNQALYVRVRREQLYVKQILNTNLNKIFKALTNHTYIYAYYNILEVDSKPL